MFNRNCSDISQQRFPAIHYHLRGGGQVAERLSGLDPRRGAPRPLPLSSCCLCGRGIESWRSHREAGQLLEQRWERCSQHPPRGPFGATQLLPVMLVHQWRPFFSVVAQPPEGGERTGLRLQWSGKHGRCVLASAAPLCKLSPLCLAPFLLKPPGRSPLQVGSAVTFPPSAPGLGRRHLHLFLTSPGESGLHPWTGWEWGIRDLINPWSYPSGPPRPRILLFPS